MCRTAATTTLTGRGSPPRPRRITAHTGQAVAVSIDDTRRPAATVETDYAQRADRRAAHLQAKADRHATGAEHAEQASRQISNGIPPGQPILTGHHSEGRHRRDLDRIERNQRRELDEHRTAEDAARRAQVAARRAQYRHLPVTVGNRIEQISAEIRARHRKLAGYRTHLGDVFAPATGDYADQLHRDLDGLTDQLAYWQQVRAQQITAGTAGDYGPHRIHAGDHVRIRGQWYPVIRANRKTVTVPSPPGTRTNTAPYHEISGHQPASNAAQPARTEA